jgi:hypothetical protein
LHSGIHREALLGLGTEELAFEPLELLLQRGQLRLQLGIFLLQLGDLRSTRQGDLYPCFCC